MAIQLQGASGVIAQVDNSFDAVRVSNRPLDPGALGAYRLSTFTGTMAAGLGANSEIFQFRWAESSGKLCVIHKIMFDGLGSITAFAAGVINIRAAIARSWTVDGSGGTAIVLTGNNQKCRASFASADTELTARISSTAALTAGTKTTDTQNIGGVVGGVGASPAVMLPAQPFMDSYGGTEHPIVLAQNEGIVILATVPATGTWVTGVTITWSEVLEY